MKKKSGLWWEMYKIIGDLRPRIVVLENVSNILSVGGTAIIGSPSIGYCSEWKIGHKTCDFGAPHKKTPVVLCFMNPKKIKIQKPLLPTPTKHTVKNNPGTPSAWQQKSRSEYRNSQKPWIHKRYDWQEFPVESAFVEQMMGFPIGYTELEPQAMQ